MKIVIAPDSFKESLSASAAAQAIANSLSEAIDSIECVCLPMADGGEGTAKTLCDLANGQWREVIVHDPLGRKVKAGYALLDRRRAVIEMAEAAGLQLLSTSERNPAVTSTYGVGELILDALNEGVTEFIIGIGGSATNDGGSGMLSALGVKFLDKTGQTLPAGGLALSALDSVSLLALDKRLQDCKMTIACDVNNPLLGTNGASAIFAPQKGANAELVEQLDKALANYAEKMVAAGFPAVHSVSGSGAAGGLGFALLGLPNVSLESGISLVMREAKLLEHCQNADYVITGEGRMDGQTLSGQVPLGVLQCASQQNIPVIALCGCLGEQIEILEKQGFLAILPTISHLDSLENTLANGEQNLRRTARQVGKLLSSTFHLK
ncbi:glycerate kinase [Suttonella ornithocola]|uniref:Glycerate kinase n=2 Tax=Suttonella ornithocola TaxID=279832 RepID=A0A380MY18_9GAMM|nr:glycerate kinase [Suttonella ornithocola]SUO97192.1 Glycerate kinase [Suttonella ornithocola]